MVDRVEQPITGVVRLYGRLSPFSAATFFFSLERSGSGSGLEGKERLMALDLVSTAFLYPIGSSQSTRSRPRKSY